MLFRFAKEVFGGDLGKYDNIVNTLQFVCTQFRQQLVNKARNALVEDVIETNTRKRTSKMLDDGILFAELSATAIPSSTPSSSTSLSSAISSPASSTGHDLLPSFQHENPSWSFVDAWRKHTGSAMDWDSCFNIEKDIGLFKKYKSKNVAKSVYFRSKTLAK